MQNLHKYFPLSHFGSKNLYPEPNNTPFLCLFSSVSSLVQNHNSTPTSNPSISNFLIETLAFSEPLAITISNRFPPPKTLENPHSVVQFLRQLGFSNTQVRSSIRLRPNMLFSDIDKTLKPKLQFFQDLGFTGPCLCNFISKHPHVLLDSLEKKWIPCIAIIKKILVNDKNNQDLIRVMQGSYWFCSKPVSRMKCNIAFLESCGIVGSQLSMLLKRRPSLMFRREQSLKNIVSRVSDMGFPIGSRMLVHAVDVVGGTSVETFNRKIELYSTFGFSADECMEMFRRAPTLLGTSEGKLKLGMEFFLNEVKLERNLPMEKRNSGTKTGIRIRVLATDFPQVQCALGIFVLKVGGTFVTIFSNLKAWFDICEKLGSTVLNQE
ncbi:hypothetical protein Vadar_011636 [Vaccinium darrowii]|uniref:Uncharacterized protein n=1 Tax=Vaccinium darrowii TaxID=229202 RepID=A0ACB7Z4L7_9ERIC|nr:hypothetical protein Vadar_011636 [Vaccinium darrowii]